MLKKTNNICCTVIFSIFDNVKNHTAARSLKKVFVLFLLGVFLLSDSHLFLYRHFCHDTLYGTSFFGKISCPCDGNNSLLLVQEVNVMENDCCKEIVLFARIKDVFYSHTTFFIFFISCALLSLSFLPSTHLEFITNKFSLIYYLYRKKSENFSLFYIQTFSLSTIVLRN